jgi:hypothetical protein
MRFGSLRLVLAALLALSTLAVVGCRTGAGAQGLALSRPAALGNHAERDESPAPPANPPCRFG